MIVHKGKKTKYECQRNLSHLFSVNGETTNVNFASIQPKHESDSTIIDFVAFISNRKNVPVAHKSLTFC